MKADAASKGIPIMGVVNNVRPPPPRGPCLFLHLDSSPPQATTASSISPSPVRAAFSLPPTLSPPPPPPAAFLLCAVADQAGIMQVAPVEFAPVPDMQYIFNVVRTPDPEPHTV